MKLVTLWSVTLTTTPDRAEFFANALSDEAVSLTVMSPPRSTKAEIEAIFDAEPHAGSLQSRIAITASLHDIKPPALNIKQLPKLDWLKKVAEDFPPLPIARWIVFGAQHKTRAAQYRKIPLQIDATSAFGTGEHPTTRGCMLMLDWLMKRNCLRNTRRSPLPLAGRVREGGERLGSFSILKKTTKRNSPLPNPSRKGEGILKMLDMGCGSGILAMAYAKTTHGKAYGVDLDADSVEIARINIRANGLQQNMRVTLGNGYHTPLVKQNAPYDLIMANIFAGPLCQMANALRNHLKPGGHAILSGLLNYQANRVIAAHRMQGLRLIRHCKLGEWSVLAFKRS